MSFEIKKVFALVDCNNFYASCERLFRPELNGKPIVVLSNNDGCIVARSNEAKALGVPMGAPLFKMKYLVAKHGIHVFSSNYALYGDLSHRVMEVLRQMECYVEVYSIDEAFISLPVSKTWNRLKYAAELRERVRKNVGIPVSIGIATTKTLAKVANRVAKKDVTGVFDLVDNLQTDQILQKMAIGDIWGIGRQSVEKLNRYGIRTAYDLKRADEKLIRKLLTVVGARTLMELNEIPCISLEQAPPCPKSIVTSRSFGHPITDFEHLKEAVVSYVSRAAEKLRKQEVEADTLNVFITTGPFDEQSQYSNNQTITLPRPTASTPDMIEASVRCLKLIYRPGYRYRKAGVLITGIVKHGFKQQNLFAPVIPEREDKPLMAALDKINEKWGRNAIQYGIAATVTERPWSMQQSQKSPAYTTNWHELPVVKTAR